MSTRPSAAYYPLTAHDLENCCRKLMVFSDSEVWIHEAVITRYLGLPKNMEYCPSEALASFTASRTAMGERQKQNINGPLNEQNSRRRCLLRRLVDPFHSQRIKDEISQLDWQMDKIAMGRWHYTKRWTISKRQTIRRSTNPRARSPNIRGEKRKRIDVGPAMVGKTRRLSIIVRSDIPFQTSSFQVPSWR